MKRFLFAAALALAPPVLAQQPPVTKISPLSAVAQQVKADGQIYRFVVAVDKSNPLKTDGNNILDSDGKFYYVPSVTWTLVKGNESHPGWPQPGEELPQGNEMFKRYVLSTPAPAVALTTLGYTLSVNGRRYRKPDGGGGGGGPAGDPTEPWGASRSRAIH